MAIVALAWSLSKPYMTALIVGMSKVEKMEEACRAVEFELSEDDVKSIGVLYKPKDVVSISV